MTPNSQERRQAAETVVDMLREQIGKNEAGLNAHIDYCTKLQKWQIVIGCVILLLVEGHSPEVAALVDKIVKALLP